MRVNGLSFLWVTAFGSAIGGFSSLAMAQEDTESNGLKFETYGQINMGILSLDDGVNSDTFLTDNDNSNTRVGFNVYKTLDSGSRIRFQFETALGLTGSSSTTPTDNSLDITMRRTELRRFDFSYASDSFGTFSLGQGSTATDGIAEYDLSGTSVISYSSLSDLGAAVAFRTTAGVQSGITVGSVFSNYDGARRFRVRYDTPDFNGFSGAISYGQEILSSGDNNDYYDVALRYNQKYGDFSVNSGIGFSDRDNNTERVSGSVSVLHTPTGLNGTLATGKNLNGNETYIFAKAGILRDWFSIGNTALSVSFYDGDDFASVNAESKSYDISAVQKIDRYNLEVFASYRTFEYADTINTYQDVNAAMIGARFKF